MKHLPKMLLILLATAATSLAADEAAAKKPAPDFAAEVHPILKRNCLACHNATKAKADLILETPADMIKGGDSGSALVPGDAEASFVYTVSAHTEEPTMPPEKNKSNAKKLTSDELAILKAWIDAGAVGGAVIAAAPENWRALSGPQPVYSAAVSDNGRFAAAGRGQQIQLYDLVLGQPAATLLDPEISDKKSFPKGAAHNDLVQALTFSKHGDLASGGYRITKVWRRNQPAKSADIALATKVTTSANSADQKWQAFGAADGNLSLIDASAAEPKPETTKLPGGAITALAFSADGANLAATTADKKLHLRASAAGSKPKSTTLAAPATAVAFIENGKTLATSSADGSIRLTPLTDFDPKPAPAPAPKPLATPAAKPAAPKPAPTPKTAPAKPPTPAPAVAAKPDDCSADEAKPVAEPAPAKPAPKPAAVPPTPKPATPAPAAKPAPKPAATPTPTAPAPAPAPVELKGHTQAIIALHSPKVDGSELIAVHQDGTVVHWSVATKKELRRIAHGTPITVATLSPDGTKLLTAGAKIPAKLWNLADGKLIGDIAHPPATQQSIDALQRRIDVETRLVALHTAAATKAATEVKAESDKAIEAAAKTAAERRDLEVKTDQLTALQRNTPATAEAEVTKAKDAVTLARRTLTGSERNQSLGVRLSAAAADRQAAALASSKRAEASKTALTAEIEALKKLLAELDTTAPLVAAAFSPDGGRVALLRKTGLLEQWSVSAAPVWLENSQTTADIAALRWRIANQLWLVQAESKPIEVWDITQPWNLASRLGDGKNGEIFPDRVTAVTFDPSGTQLLTGSGVPSRNGGWKLWDISNAASPVVVLDSAEAHSDTVSDFAFSPDGERFASSATDRMVKVWNTRSGELEHTFEGHSGHVLSVDWSPDGRTLASGSGDRQVKLWDIESGEQKSKVEGFGKEITTVNYIGSTDTLLTACGDATLKVNNQPLAGATGFIHEADITADGKRVIAGADDGALRVWDATTRQILHTFADPARAEPAVAGK